MEIVKTNQLEKQQPKLPGSFSDLENKCIASAKGTKIIDATDTQFRQLLLYLFNLIGLNTDRYPDDLQMIVLNDFVRGTYGSNTLDEVKLAFQMAISGKLECESNPYQNFSSAYFGGIMAAYRVWASQVHDYHERTRQEPKQIEQTPIEMPDDEYVKAAFETFKAIRRYEVIPENIYLILEKSKKIDLDKDTKARIKAQVMDKINTGLRTNADFVKEYAGITDKEGYIKSACRRSAVARYFSQVILEGREI